MMLNGNGSLDTQTHRLIQAWVTDIPTNEMKILADPPPAPAITGMHQLQPGRSEEPRD
jgi:hypothetical protein